MSLLFGKKLGVDRLPGPLVNALEPLRRERAIRRFTTGGLRRSYPSTPEDLRASALWGAWWYYSTELLPGLVADGQFPDDMPMLPRLMLRRCRVSGQSCLDIGTMEGLVPTLLAKRGAREVLAVDFSNHCVGKIGAVKHYHGVDFEYRSVGLMYALTERLRPRSFDLINLSGLLYHVYSPLGVLGAARPLLNRNALMVVSTYVTLDPGPVMDFNAGGRMWAEGNTFWFPSVALLDYLLRYMRLQPIDCVFMSNSELQRPGLERVSRISDRGLGKDAGYLSVACRAVDRADADAWMTESVRSSWEYHGHTDWSLVDRRPSSSIGYEGIEPSDGLDLHTAVLDRPRVERPAARDDSHMLALAAAA
jgi:2-polyprenyl-3-methyl-5-hydroxy-6-metoxy-1,4-benzoquinol methylase